MRTLDLSNRDVQRFIEFAKQKGYATRDNLRIYLPFNISPEELERAASTLIEMGIEVRGRVPLPLREAPLLSSGNWLVV